jgi:predicted DNA-binding protein with PD1-like motif
VVVIEIKDAELITALEARAAELGVTDAAIVSLIGAADSFTVSTMPAGDANDDVLTDYQVPGEMSGTGELVAGKAHVHATFGVHGDRAVTGHLHSAQVTTHFARVYLTPVTAA